MHGSSSRVPSDQTLEQEREGLLHRVEQFLEKPIIILGLVWLVLLILEFTRGLTPGLQFAGTLIWIAFIIDFLVRFIIAPRKLRFVRRNVLTLVSLGIPALRLFRFFQVFRLLRLAPAIRTLRLVRLITSLNRGMAALGVTLRRRGFGYVVALTVLVTFGGAAGMFALERDSEPKGFSTFGASLWWTAMMMTTMGSDVWPQSAEGRVLCWLLALYAFGIWGYVTATIASFFLGSDKSQRQQKADAEAINALRNEINALRKQLPPSGHAPPADLE